MESIREFLRKLFGVHSPSKEWTKIYDNKKDKKK